MYCVYLILIPEKVQITNNCSVQHRNDTSMCDGLDYMYKLKVNSNKRQKYYCSYIFLSGLPVNISPK